MSNIIYVDELRQKLDEWLNSKEFEVWHGHMYDRAQFASASCRKFIYWLESEMWAHPPAEKPKNNQK